MTGWHLSARGEKFRQNAVTSAYGTFRKYVCFEIK